MRNKIIFMLLLIFSFTLLVGCNLSKEPTAPTQTVDNSVRVKFYVDDEIYSSKKHDKGSEIKLPEDPVKEGYKFIGWYTEDGDIISKKFIVEEALNIYAKFEEIESTIKDTYIVNFYIEEKLYYSIEVEKNNKIPGVEDPMSPTGYYFYGWVDDNNKEVSLSDKVNSNLNLHAVFYPILEPPMQYYEVYYYVEGGLYSIETYEPGIYITPSFEPYLGESYQFIGWFDEYGNQYFGSYIYENISLYAEFKEITYEVRYYVDGSLDKVENYQKGSYIDYLYTPTTPYNYNFVGWFDEYGNQYYGGYIYSNINLYAKFEEIIPFTYNEYDSYIEITGYIGTDSNVIIPDYINSKPVTEIAAYAFYMRDNLTISYLPFSITYIGAGAFRGCYLDNIVVKDYGTYQQPFVDCEGHVYFYGNHDAWYNANLGLSYEQAYFYYEDRQINFRETWRYVDGIPTVWEDVYYNITLIVDGEIYEEKQVLHGDNINCPWELEKEGYKFLGWYDLYDKWYYGGDIVISDLILYAKFEQILNFTYNEYSDYIEITGYIGTDSNVIIPDYINGKPVTHVASNFQGNSISNIKTLKIGKNISYIENGAFSFGKGLESVYCDSIEYWLNITFNGYTANPVYCDAKLYVDGQLLEHVEIPSHITEIKPYTFILSTLKTINLNNVITIGELAFYKSALTELYLPASVRNIGLDTFSLCTSLVKIDVDYMNPVYKSGYLCINSAMPTPANTIIEKSTGNLILGCSNSHITSDVTNISYGSLSNFMAETLYIPSTVTSIDQSAFLGMQSTIDVYYNGSYEQWISITGNNIYFKNVYYDYQWTYKDNEFVTDVLFNGNVYYSYVDEEYQIVGISRSESIGDVVDLSLHFDTRFSIDLDIVHIENMFNKNIYQFIIDKNTSSIDIKNYFYGYPIFYYESNESDWNNVLLSDNVIDYFFVYYYSEVQPTQDGYYWHYDEFGQPAIWDELIIPTYNGFTYIEYEYYIEITGYIGNSDVVEIPTEINGMPVISIADNSFEGCNFKELIIPSIINDIGNNILRGCENLEKLTTPFFCSKNTNVLASMFGDLSNYSDIPVSLKEVTLTNIDYIVDYSFYCSYVEKITLADNTVGIGDAAFKCCDSLKYIDLKNVTGIANNAFYNTYNLEYLIIPNTVDFIGEYAFSHDVTGVETLYPLFFEEGGIGENYSVIDGHYVYLYSELEPSYAGNYWHYVDGIPTIWKKHIHNLEFKGGWGTQDDIYYAEAYCTSCSFYYSEVIYASVVERVESNLNERGYIKYEAIYTIDDVVYTEYRIIDLPYADCNHSLIATFDWESFDRKNVVASLSCEYCIYNEIYSPGCYIIDSWGTLSMYTVVYEASIYYGGEIYTDTHDVSEYFSHDHNFGSKCNWGTDIYDSYFELYCNVCGMTFLVKADVTISEEVDSTLEQRGYIVYMASGTLIGVEFSETYTQYLDYAYCNHYFTLNTDWDKIYNCYVICSLDCAYCIYSYNSSVYANVIEYTSATADSKGYISYEVELNYNGVIYRDSYSEILEATDHIHVFEDKSFWGTQDDIYYHDSYCTGCGFALHKTVYAYEVDRVEATQYENGYIIYQVEYELDGLVYSEFRTVTLYYK